MSIAPGSGQSMITFGGYDADTYATGPINWHKIGDWSSHWEVELEDFTFEGHGNWTKDEFKGRKIIVDSGTSYVMIPKHDLNKYLKILENNTGMTCSEAKNLPTCSCTFKQY